MSWGLDGTTGCPGFGHKPYGILSTGHPKVIEVRREHGINHTHGMHSDGETGSRRKRVDEIRLSSPLVGRVNREERRIRGSKG